MIAHADDPIPEEDVYFSNDLDSYPIVDRTLVDYTQYYDVMGQGGIFTTMVTREAVRTDVLLQHTASPLSRDVSSSSL